MKGFVVGTGRSGTTLLVNLLGSHSQLSPLYELEFLLNIMTWIRKDKTIVPKELLGLLYTWGSGLGGLPFLDIWDKNYDKKRPRFGSKYANFTKDHLMLAAVRFLDNLKQEPAEQALAAFINTLSDIQARNDKKPHTIIKTPGVMQIPSLILSGMPQCKFIHIYRDGRDVWCSIKNYSWGPDNVRNAAVWWSEHMRLAEEIKRISPDSILEVRYESLLGEPQETLEGIFAFLGLEPEPIAFELSPSSVQRFRKEMTREELEEFNKIAGSQLLNRGYPVGG